MRTKSCPMVSVALCALLVPSLFGAADSSESKNSGSVASTPSSKEPAPVAPKKTPSKGSEIDSSGSTASKLSDEERVRARRRHIRSDDRFRMEAPPPPVRQEARTAAPGPNYVWKPGHWEPVRGEWQWIAGEWAVPPTSISVWIEGKYDEKDQRWAPGYWEPDTIQLAEPEAPPSKSTPVQKY
jgi:hypothetical protein